MINSVTELQDLILWLKSEKVKSLKIGEIHVELSDYALLESFADETAPVSAAEPKNAQENWTEEVPPAADKVDDEDLFWSTR